MFVAGIYQQLLAETKNMEKLIKVFKKGGGISLKEFDDNEFTGMERMTATWFENLLLQEWIPAVPDIKSKLEKGALVADVGCGRGRAIINLVQAFPNSQFVGCDIFGPVVEYAKSQAASVGISDNRISFQQLDISKGFPEEQQHCYDLITMFDVIHDMANPRCIESHLSRTQARWNIPLVRNYSRDRLEGNIGTMGALFYCWSIVYCMTTSLAEGGKVLGTVGMPQSKVIEYCREVGFSHVRKLPGDNPFNVLYEVKHKEGFKGICNTDSDQIRLLFYTKEQRPAKM
jgi:SAM-dependent methyltransferase